VGAWTYNLAHHKGIAVVLFVLGGYLQLQWLQLVGAIMLGHSSFDRMLGYGLKYTEGRIGRATTEGA
jgi:hypothetical protein